MTPPVVVRGTPTAEELAALLAVVTRPSPVQAPSSAYARWRATRLRALRTGDGQTG